MQRAVNTVYSNLSRRRCRHHGLTSLRGVKRRDLSAHRRKAIPQGITSSRCAGFVMTSSQFPANSTFDVLGIGNWLFHLTFGIQNFAFDSYASTAIIRIGLGSKYYSPDSHPGYAGRPVPLLTPADRFFYEKYVQRRHPSIWRRSPEFARCCYLPG